MVITLSAQKTIVKGNEDIVLTLVYPVEFEGKEAILQEKQFGGGSVIVSKLLADASGQTTFTIRSSIQGAHTYWAVITPCWGILNCEYSNDVTISVTDAECGNWDLLCRLTPQLDTNTIIALIVIVILIIVYFSYSVRVKG